MWPSILILINKVEKMIKNYKGRDVIWKHERLTCLDQGSVQSPFQIGYTYKQYWNCNTFGVKFSDDIDWKKERKNKRETL